MNEIDRLYNEYNELKQSYLKNNTIEKKEELKNKLIELDYEKSKLFGEEIDKKFPMTTTLDKEAKRLTDLITYIQENIQVQKELVNDYKKLTGTTIELSYLKSSDRLLDYKKRLENVKRFLSIRTDLSKLVNSKDEKDLIKIKVLKNRLLTEEILNLLYEFCLIDSLDITDIDVKKLVDGEKQDIEIIKEELKPKREIKIVKDKKIKIEKLPKKIEIIKEDNKNKIEEKNIKNQEEKVEKIKEEPKVEEKKILKPETKQPVQEKKVEIPKEIIEKRIEEPKKEIKVEKESETIKHDKVKTTESIIEEEIEKHEQKVLTSMPIVEKIGSVVPVNVFESLKKTEEKIPNVVLPSNGLKDDQNDIFVETKDLFAETEKK